MWFTSWNSHWAHLPIIIEWNYIWEILQCGIWHKNNVACVGTCRDRYIAHPPLFLEYPIFAMHLLLFRIWRNRGHEMEGHAKTGAMVYKPRLQFTCFTRRFGLGLKAGILSFFAQNLRNTSLSKRFFFVELVEALAHEVSHKNHFSTRRAKSH